MRFVIVAGTTQTARIEGISAAGADPDLMAHTPSADLEIVEFGDVVTSPVVPVSPTGCPTPAVVTRAVSELVDFETLFVDAGLETTTAAPTVDIGAAPGDDIRTADPVSAASDVFERARELGQSLPDDELVIGETIPGGTTTALGVLTALGERTTVSSSLPENPIELKRQVVAEALAANGLQPGGAADDPITAVGHVGDPVLTTVAGLVVGATESGSEVTLAGGTQMAAAAALSRHSGIDAPLSLATTSFIASDGSAKLDVLADDLRIEATATDPRFDRLDHPAMNAYVRGEAKEGVGMGGALALAAQAGVEMGAIREQITEVYDRIVEGVSPEP